MQVYVKAKECSEQISMEDFAIVLGKHFTTFYQQQVDSIMFSAVFVSQ